MSHSVSPHLLNFFLCRCSQTTGNISNIIQVQSWSRSKEVFYNFPIAYKCCRHIQPYSKPFFSSWFIESKNSFDLPNSLNYWFVNTICIVYLSGLWFWKFLLKSRFICLRPFNNPSQLFVVTRALNFNISSFTQNFKMDKTPVLLRREYLPRKTY